MSENLIVERLSTENTWLDQKIWKDVSTIVFCSLKEKTVKAYSDYKPYLLYWALIGDLYQVLYKQVVSSIYVTVNL